MKDLFDFLKFMMPLIIILSLLFFAVYMVNGHSCSVYAKNTGRKTNFDFGSCYVNLAGDRYIPQTELNYRAVTNEVK